MHNEVQVIHSSFKGNLTVLLLYNAMDVLHWVQWWKWRSFIPLTFSVSNVVRFLFNYYSAAQQFFIGRSLHVMVKWYGLLLEVVYICFPTPPLVRFYPHVAYSPLHQLRMSTLGMLTPVFKANRFSVVSNWFLILLVFIEI